MKATIICHNAQQAHTALTAVLWPQVKSHLLCGGGVLVVKCSPQTRSLEQNARLWAMLADISKQVVWHGRRLTDHDWKHVFSASLKKQDAVPGIDGGFVVLGQSTSRMTKAEMSDLQTLMEAFGAGHGVVWSASADLAD